MKPGERKQEKLDAYEQLFERYPFLSRRWFAEKLKSSRNSFTRWEKEGFPPSKAAELNAIVSTIAADLLSFKMPKARTKKL